MEVTPQEEEEVQASTRQPSALSILSRLNIPFLIVAAIAGLVATNSDPWWIMSASQSSNILQASVSPFFVRITGLGVPTTMPNSDSIGLTARVVLGLTAAALAWQGLFPMSVWRKPVLWLSLSSFAGQFFAFAILFHSTQEMLLQQYGFVAQLSGSSVAPGVVLGTDFVAYANPTFSSSLGLPFFAGLGCFIILGGSELLNLLLWPNLGLGLSEFTSGLTGAFLSPPYQHAWLTSTDQDLNPLAQDPNRLTDDELALSFERLLKVLQPGAAVSVILPPWATRLSDRLARVVSWTGFDLENSRVIFRAPGKPENELVFRKPVPPESPETELTEEESLEQSASLELATESEEGGLQTESGLGNSVGPKDDLSNDLYKTRLPRNVDGRPPLEEQIEDPSWAQPQPEPDQPEPAIINSALSIIGGAGEPIPYQELVDRVSLDMLEQEVGLTLENQVEDTLLNHVGLELSLIEQLDEDGASGDRYWWLGESGVWTEPKSNKVRTRLSEIGTKVRNMKGLFSTRREETPSEELQNGADATADNDGREE